MSGTILDASAVIALLKDEPGGQKVGAVIRDARISSVNLAEVVTHFARNRMPAPAIDAMLRRLSLTIIDTDEELVMKAGLLISSTAAAGLSLADRFCLALAAREGLPAWTADRQWQKIADAISVEVVLIR